MVFKIRIEVGSPGMEDQHDVAHALRQLADRLGKSVSSGWSPYQLSGEVKARGNDRVVGGWSVDP